MYLSPTFNQALSNFMDFSYTNSSEKGDGDSSSSSSTYNMNSLATTAAWPAPPARSFNYSSSGNYDGERCLFSTNYIDGKSVLNLPLTRCVKHGKSGYLPLIFIKDSQYYTSITLYRGETLIRVTHAYEDCILEFPADPTPHDHQHAPADDHQNYQHLNKKRKIN